MGRGLRLGAAALTGVAAGLALAVVALVGLLFLVGWLRSESPTTRAHRDVQSFFGSTAKVRGCTQIARDDEGRVFRCTIAAPGCVRTHRFALVRDDFGGYDVAPYFVSGYVNEHPCRYPSD